MTESTAATSAFLRENINRQTKRLHSQLDIPLTTAKQVIANIYRCSSWVDLSTRVDTNKTNQHIVLLASLPNSRASEQYLLENMSALSSALIRTIQTNTNIGGTYGLLRYVFGFPSANTTLSDIAPSITASSWCSENIGPDPDAVIYSLTTINNVQFKLIGTRVYLPSHFKFGSEITSSPIDATPLDESLKIIWSNPESWYDAAYAYLLAFEDEDELELGKAKLVLPIDELTQEMKAHEEWLYRALIRNNIYCDDDQIIPYILPQGCYIIFGIPCNHPVDLSNQKINTLTLPSDREIDNIFILENYNTVFLLDDQPLCVEWITTNVNTGKHEGIFQEYFETLSNGIFHHPDCNLDHYLESYWKEGFFFVTPCSEEDIHSFNKVEIKPSADEEAIIMKSDQLQLASIVIDKAADGDVEVYSNKRKKINYLIVVDISKYDNIKGLSLSINIVGQGWSMCNLIHETSTYNNKLYLCIDPELFTLLDLINKKEIKKEIQYGIILYRPAGFHKLLKKPQNRTVSIKYASKEVIDLIERPFDISSPDIFSEFNLAQYERDNY